MTRDAAAVISDNFLNDGPTRGGAMWRMLFADVEAGWGSVAVIVPSIIGSGSIGYYLARAWIDAEKRKAKVFADKERDSDREKKDLRDQIIDSMREQIAKLESLEKLRYEEMRKLQEAMLEKTVAVSVLMTENMVLKAELKGVKK